MSAGTVTMLEMMADSAKVPWSDALRYWWRLGWTSFGGPAGQIAMMHTEVVEHRRWLSESRFLHALNYTMALPGPEAQQLAIYIGWLMHGRWGGIVAGTLFVLPSLLLMIVAAWAYLAYGELPAVEGVLWGVKPVVVAIVAAAAWRIGRRVLRGWAPPIIAAGAFIAMAVFSVPFPLIVGAAAGVGALVVWRFPTLMPGAPLAPHGLRSEGRAVIGDDTPSPSRMQFSWSRLMGVAGTGLALWAVAMAMVIALDRGGLLPELAAFFTKVALVTFGGAYAVLPYVYQAAVEGYGWVTTAQMIDGLALGESTPGPLIMVVAFVGYLAGAAADGTQAGVISAVVVTFFTFLPSFLFILLGAPLIEATRGMPQLTGPLGGITAAVVGVILNLAVFFGLAVFLPASVVDWAAVVLAVSVLVLLVTDRIGVVSAVAAGAIIGLILQLVK